MKEDRWTTPSMRFLLSILSLACLALGSRPSSIVAFSNQQYFTENAVSDDASSVLSAVAATFRKVAPTRFNTASSAVNPELIISFSLKDVCFSAF